MLISSVLYLMMFKKISLFSERMQGFRGLCVFLFVLMARGCRLKTMIEQIGVCHASLISDRRCTRALLDKFYLCFTHIARQFLLQGAPMPFIIHKNQDSLFKLISSRKQYLLLRNCFIFINHNASPLN